MNAIAEKTRNVLATLSDIQPAVSVSGLTEESVKIQSMKRDLRRVLKEMDSGVVMGRMVASLHADVISQALELGSVLLDRDPDKMDDEHLQRLSLTAQCFAEKAQDYLACKVHLGGQYGN
jgi:hypothetical protein